MAQANVLPGNEIPPLGDGVGAAWRRFWTRADAGPGRGSPPPGVTYRGYLGADGGASAQWMTEQQMREMQALLRTAAAVGRLGAWSVELSGMNWVWSDEVKAIHEVAADYRPTTEDALRFYTPASQELAVEAFEACGKNGEPFDIELQLITAQGNKVWIRTIGEAERDAQGRITHLRGAIQDISRFRAVADEARRLADRLTRTLESLGDGYILLDAAWCFVYVNGEAERILRRSRAELKGRCLLAEFPETAEGTFLERCQEARGEGRTVEFEKFYRSQGIWVYWKVCPSDMGFTVCIRDDTARINARREILALKAELAALKNRADRSPPAAAEPNRSDGDGAEPPTAP
ncbi:MAG TPA: PAS domain-containing protein [Ramlibacter sp.]|nr:PAS domain-containing protein [Ramlibacter sp.]